ncbi:hypothetical protein WJX72_001641 [[Myrmecia] bisecta]|uniref:Nudix hydrolase domain-containing protein n=1 Tax=[Myrmecia] bisecta TaxID=41462 RepID=A0AAW1QE95_9CHLO
MAFTAQMTAANMDLSASLPSRLVGSSRTVQRNPAFAAVPLACPVKLMPCVPGRGLSTTCSAAPELMQAQLAEPLSAADFSSGTIHRDFCLSGLNGLTAGGTSGLEHGCFQVTASQPVSYCVEEVSDIFDLNNKALLRGMVPDSFPARLAPAPIDNVRQRRFIVIDEVVYNLYGEQLRQYMKHHNVDYDILPVPTCEPNKSFNLVFMISERLEAFKLNRRQEPIIAIGGGVCLDVAGLAANLYRRNTPLIKVPTTVMAAVDASIGIKTAVNFHGRKNKLGTYCPPLAVFIDKTFLKTLDVRHLSNGSAEILKMACIKDAELFELLEQHGAELLNSKYQSHHASTIMRRSIQGMLEELEYNLWEHILQRLVDYGHAFSPEIEMAALVGDDAMLLHGEAVNIDMALTTQLAFQRGLISEEQRARVYGVMNKLGLALWHDVCNDTKMLLKGLADTTLARDGLQRVPLMSGIGDAQFVNDLTEAEVGGPVPLLSRVGRELQRYSGSGERLVAGCIPVRITSLEAGVDGVEVLLISSRGGKGLVFPKGGWETDETVEAAAARETVEEAGVRGELEGQMVGVFPFYSSKAARVHIQGRCIAYMFVMHVVEELPAWPEQAHRTRVWCSVREACNNCRHEWMREALETWLRRQGWDHVLHNHQPNGNSNADTTIAPPPCPERIAATS